MLLFARGTGARISGTSAPFIGDERTVDEIRKTFAILCAAVATIAGATAAQAQPNPVLIDRARILFGRGRNWVRHRYDVFNKDQYPAAMFARLPGCRRAEPTQFVAQRVDFFDCAGKRLYGFCALGSPANLGSIWFATEEARSRKLSLYRINDRQTNTSTSPTWPIPRLN